MKRKEIEQLQAVGLISTDQTVAIAEHFHLNGVPYPEAVEQMRNKTFIAPAIKEYCLDSTTNWNLSRLTIDE